MALNPPVIQNHSRARDFGNPIIQVVMLIAFLVLFSWFVLKPKLSQSNEARTTLKAAEEHLARTKQDQQDLNRLINDLRSSPEELAKIDEALPLSGRVSKAYVLLEDLVRSSGMNLTLISTSDTSKTISAGDKPLLENPYQPGRELHEITLTTTLTGSMEQLRNLLQLIETNGRVLDVATVDVIGGEAITKYKITVKAYAYEKLVPKAQ